MSRIEWTDVTWNPVTGCDRTSPGCDHCYALTMARRLKMMGNVRYQVDGDPETSGPGFGLTLHPDKLDEPLHWRAPRRVFVNSMSDLFHPEVPEDFIASAFTTMANASQHTFQVLTKRPQRMRKVVSRLWLCDCEVGKHTLIDSLYRPERVSPFPNVWLGTSIESDRYSFRADHLRDTPAAVRFLSCEPLLGPLPSLDLTGMDWVIVGGESGPGARPVHPSWVREIRDRCVEAAVPFFFKQWGAWAPHMPAYMGDRRCGFFGYNGEWSGPNARIWGTVNAPEFLANLGKHNAGRIIDGRTWSEYPQVMA